MSIMDLQHGELLRPMPSYAPPLDALLNTAEAAQWLNMTTETFLEKASGSEPEIPLFRLGKQSLLLHPRTFLAYRMRRCGLTPEEIAASFGLVVFQKQ